MFLLIVLYANDHATWVIFKKPLKESEHGQSGHLESFVLLG